MLDRVNIQQQLAERFGERALHEQITADGMPTLWVGRDLICDVLKFLRQDSTPAYRMLFDLTAIDERVREHRLNQPAADFTVVYHLLSLSPVAEIRLKVALFLFALFAFSLSLGCCKFTSLNAFCLEA